MIPKEDTAQTKVNHRSSISATIEQHVSERRSKPTACHHHRRSVICTNNTSESLPRTADAGDLHKAGKVSMCRAHIGFKKTGVADIVVATLML